MNGYIKLYDNGNVYAYFQIKDKYSGWQTHVIHHDEQKTSVTLTETLGDWLLIFCSPTVFGNIKHSHFQISQLTYGYAIPIRHAGESDTFLTIYIDVVLQLSFLTILSHYFISRSISWISTL